MKKISCIKNKSFIISLGIISICIVFFVTYLSQNCCFFDDDYFYAMYDFQESVFSCLNFQKEHGAGYIGFFLCKFFSFKLPNLLGIHPTDFMGIQQGIFQGIISVVILLLIAKFSIIYKKSKLLYLISFLYLSVYLFFSIFMYDAWIFIVNYGFYRYLFSFLFFTPLLYFLYQNTTELDVNKNIFQLILICLCAFVLGTGIELSFYITAFFIALIIITNLFCYFIKKPLMFKINKNFYLPAIFLYTAMTLFITSEGYKTVAGQRGMDNIHLTIDTIKEYIVSFWQICFVNEIVYWLVFLIVLISCICFAKKKGETSKILFPIYLQFSILTLFFSLLLCDKTFYGNFFLLHHNVQFLYKMHILFPLLILISYFLEQIESTKKFVCVLFVIFFTLSIPYFVKKHLFSDYTKSHLYVTYKAKQNFYITEKMLRFYYLKKQIPIIQYKIDFYEYMFQDYDLEKPEIQLENRLSRMYYPQIYKDKTSIEKGYNLSFNAIEEFYENGGVFTEEELQNIKFSNLFNEDFVLNTKGKKLTVAEIKERIKE